MMAGLLSPEDMSQINNDALMGMGMGLLSASGPSRIPVSLGQALGQGAQGYMQGRNQSQDQAMKRKMMEQQAQEHAMMNEMQQMKMAEMRNDARAQEMARQNLERYMGEMPDGPQKEQIKSAMMMGVPLSKVWEKANPDAKYAKRYNAQGQEEYGWATPQGFAPSGGAKQEQMPWEYEMGPDGKPRMRNAVIAGKGAIAAAGRPVMTTQVFNNTKDDFKNERDLRNDFSGLPTTKAFNEVRTAYDQIKTSLSSTSPAGDLAAATKFMKILDPGSVVRESELGMAMAATGAMDRLQNYGQMLMSGQKLTPAQRADFGQLSERLYSAAADRYNKSAEEYRGVAGDYGLNKDRVAKPEEIKKANSAQPAKQIVSTGTYGGRKVVKYSDGSIDYADR